MLDMKVNLNVRTKSTKATGGRRKKCVWKETEKKQESKLNTVSERARGMLNDVACGQINSKRLNPGTSNWIY